jgi:hypothetical protein
MNDQIFSYREMCDQEGVQVLQRGMNFRMKPTYSVILMSRRPNAPYPDKILSDETTIEYVGHDEPKTSYDFNPKLVNQPRITKNGKMTQNGLFVDAVDEFKQRRRKEELVKVYEKVLPGVWSMKGYFDLLDYKYDFDGKRNIFVFTLKLNNNIEPSNENPQELKHDRLIPSQVKKEVWIRDGGKCVLCGSIKNLHFDHDLPFSKGGTSLTAKNVRLLCMKCNLKKSDKIE